MALDTIKGNLYIQPDKDDIAAKGEVNKRMPKINEEHIPVHLWVNIIDPRQTDVKKMDQFDGIGLYRIEFLFMKSDRAFPTEDEQYEEYSALFKKYEEIPITVPPSAILIRPLGETKGVLIQHTFLVQRGEMKHG